MRARQQRGQILIHRGSWAIRWREYTPDETGNIKPKRCFRKLGCAQASDRRAFEKRGTVPIGIQDEANKILEPLNSGNTDTIKGTIEDLVGKYFKQATFKTSTLRAYKNIWNRYLLNRIGDKAVSAFKRVDAYHLWQDVHEANECHTLSRATMAKMRFMLSGVFEWAKDTGVYTHPENPASANLPKNLPGKKETLAYEAEEVKRLLMLLADSPMGQAIISLAWSSGVRKGELIGLKWEDIEFTNAGATIHIRRSVWNREATTPKTEKSADDVFIGAEAVEFLEAFRQSRKGIDEGYVFGYSHDQPIDLRSFARWQIEPLVNRCVECGKTKSRHNAETGHEYKRNAALPRWLGWNAFRRGAATHVARNFSGDGVTAASLVLRHTDSQTTQNHYIKTTKQERRVHEAAKVAHVAQQRQIAASVLGAGIAQKRVH